MFNWFRRIFLFLLVNVLVVTTLSIILHLLGVDRYITQYGYDFNSLVIFCLVWGFGGALISLMLSGFMAKWSMGLQMIDPDKPQNEEERWLVETVERLSRSAGLESTPEVGVYSSPEPNAFATGATRFTALVAVSTGLFNHMDKGEIEGVLGHELTHVANGDMVTMTLLQGVINAFVLFLARFIAIILSQGSRDDNRGGGGSFLLVYLLQMVLSFLGMIPLMAFSRWREFRADAGGARLAGKQKMIGALQALMKTRNMRVPQQSSAFSAFKISGQGGSLFASHPPLEERIARLRRTSAVVED